MSAKEFIKFFETSSNESEISFKDFFKLDFFSASPKKSEIKCSGEINSVIKQVRDEIFTNLRLNEFIQKKPKFVIQVLRPFYQLLKDTTSIINENQKAQLMLLLRLSKSNAKKKTFRMFFKEASSIELVNGMDKFNQEANSLFSSLLANKRIQMIITDVVNEISGSNSKSDFKSIKFRYFRSDVVGLEGFAGVNEIFVSVNELDNTIDELKNYSDLEKMALFKLKFTALVIHEVTHVILRSAMDDFNASSPKAWNKSNKNVQENKRPSFVEAGIFSENKLFKGVIDWEESAENGFNLFYCSDFLEKILKNEPADFDLNEAKVFLITKVTLLMAVDYFFEEERFL